MNITVGIPAYNEEKNIALIIKNLKKLQILLLFVMMVQVMILEKLLKIWVQW